MYKSLIRPLSNLHLNVKMALFVIFFDKSFKHMSPYVLKISQKICPKIVHFSNQSEFLKKSIILFLLASCIREADHLDELRESHVEKDVAKIYTDIPLFDEPLTLNDIIDIALERNLDVWVKKQEIKVQSEIADGFALRTLPEGNFNFEQWGRNKNTGSFSESLEPGVPPAPPSISVEQNVTRYTLSYVFNVLDFGLALYRSKMETNKALVKKIILERSKQNLVLEVTKQYWKAIAAKVARDKAETLIPKIERFQKVLNNQIARRVTSEIEGLTNQGVYINLQIQVEGYSKDYHDAIYALKQAMGVPPQTDLKLALQDLEKPLEIEAKEIPNLEEIALRARPELFQKDVEEKIAMDEVRMSLYSMIPGLAPFAQADYDGNRFLIFNHWLSAGVRSTWNLFLIPAYYQDSNTAWAKKYFARAERVQQSLMILTQVNLSYFSYYDTKRQFELMSELLKVKKRLYAIAQKKVKAGEFPLESLIKFEGEALLAEISTFKAYGDMKTALETLNNSMGLPQYFGEYRDNEELTCI